MGMRSASLKLWTVVTLLMLCGCSATPQYDALFATEADARQQAEAVFNDRGNDRANELVDVPFYPQERYQCGPATLATILNHSGVKVAPEQLVKDVYIPERKGSLQIEMVAATRQHGRLAYADAMTLTELIRLVDQNQPVLVMQNLGIELLPRWHYAVVVGYDLDKRTIILRSGTTERYEADMALFERTWQRADHWAMVALIPGSIPHDVLNPQVYFQAMTDLESLYGESLPVGAWKIASHEWSDNPDFLMGLANRYYADGNETMAAATLMDVLAIDPRYAPALNNLANIRLQQDVLDEAQALISMALLSTPESSQFFAIIQQTQRDIQQRVMQVKEQQAADNQATNTSFFKRNGTPKTVMGGDSGREWVF